MSEGPHAGSGKGPERVITVFRSRLRPEAVDEYEPMADEMSALAASMPGHVEHKTYVADDGERVTIVVFDSAEHHQAWRDDPRHREAQRRGRDRFYETYRIHTATLTYEHDFTRPPS